MPIFHLSRRRNVMSQYEAANVSTGKEENYER